MGIDQSHRPVLVGDLIDAWEATPLEEQDGHLNVIQIEAVAREAWKSTPVITKEHGQTDQVDQYLLREELVVIGGEQKAIADHLRACRICMRGVRSIYETFPSANAAATATPLPMA